MDVKETALDFSFYQRLHLVSRGCPRGLPWKGTGPQSHMASQREVAEPRDSGGPNCCLVGGFLSTNPHSSIFQMCNLGQTFNFSVPVSPLVK